MLSLKQGGKKFNSDRLTKKISMILPVASGDLFVQYYTETKTLNYENHNQKIALETIQWQQHQIVGYQTDLSHFTLKLLGGISSDLSAIYQTSLSWKQHFKQISYELSTTYWKGSGTEHISIQYDVDYFEILSPYQSRKWQGRFNVTLFNLLSIYGYYQNQKISQNQEDGYDTAAFKTTTQKRLIGGNITFKLFQPIKIDLSYQQIEFDTEGLFLRSSQDYLNYNISHDDAENSSSIITLTLNLLSNPRIGLYLKHHEFQFEQYRMIVDSFPFSSITSWINGTKLLQGTLSHMGYDLGLQLTQRWDHISIMLKTLWSPGVFKTDNRMKTRAFLVSYVDFDQRTTIDYHLLKLFFTCRLKLDQFNIIANYHQLIPLSTEVTIECEENDPKQKSTPTTITGGALFSIQLQYLF